MKFEEIVGIVAGCLTSISMLPQFFRLLKTKDSETISIGMLIVLLLGVMGWTYYGILKHDIVLITTNAFATLVNFLTLAISLKNRR